MELSKQKVEATETYGAERGQKWFKKIIQGLQILIIFAILKYKDTLRKIHISGVGKQKKKTGLTFARIQISLHRI